MANESVTCPLCEAEVEVEVMQMGVMTIMGECPACKGGPVAVELAEPIEAMAQVVTLVLEAPRLEPLVEIMRLIDVDIEAMDVHEAHAQVKEMLDEDGRLPVLFPRDAVDDFVADLARDFPEVAVVDRLDFPVELFAQAMSGENPLMNVAPDNDAMNAAIARARAEVGRFVARLARPEAGDANFAIKAPLRSGEGSEHVWINEVRVEGDDFVGLIANDPQHVPDVKLGDPWRVARGDITDWAFDAGERMHGHYTLRVMLPYFPPETQEQLAERLVPLD